MRKWSGPALLLGVLLTYAITGAAAEGLITLGRMLLGYIPAALAGLALGALLARVRTVSALAAPAVAGLQALPPICWYPLLVWGLGAGEGPVLLVAAVGTIVTVTAATETAIRTIPPDYLRAAATMGARGWGLQRLVVIPAAVPGVLAGLRAGWRTAWRALLAAELLYRYRGLGALLTAGADSARLLAVMLAILALGLAVDRLVFAYLERRVAERRGLGAAA